MIRVKETLEDQKVKCSTKENSFRANHEGGEARLVEKYDISIAGRSGPVRRKERRSFLNRSTKKVLNRRLVKKSGHYKRCKTGANNKIECCVVVRMKA